MYGVEIPYESPRSEETILAIAEVATRIDPPPFVPSADKAKAIQSQVDKEAKKVKDDEAEE